MVNHTDRDLQLRAVKDWLDTVNWAGAHTETPPENKVDEPTFRARIRFCERLVRALGDLIRAQADDEDALLYGMIVFGQMVGIRSATNSATVNEAMDLCINAGNYMITAMMATRQMQEEKKSGIITGAIH